MTTEVEGAAQEQITGLSATTEEVVDTTVEAPEEAMGQQEATEVDWQARAQEAEQRLADAEKAKEESETQREKERQDARSTKLDLLNKIRQNRDSEVQQRITRAAQDDDAAGLDTDVADIQRRYSEQERRIVVAEQVNDMAAAIDDDLTSVELNDREKRAINSVWEYGQQLWSEGRTNEALQQFREAQRDASNMVDRAERRQVKDVERRQRREDLDSGAANIATPAPTGPGSTSLGALNAKDTRKMSQQELKEHKEALFRAWEREDGVTFRR